MHLEDELFRDSRGFIHTNPGVFQKVPKGIGEILQAGALGEIAPAAEARVIEDAGHSGRLVIEVIHGMGLPGCCGCDGTGLWIN
jgi:hypothetical protein